MGKTQRLHLSISEREIPVVFLCLIAILLLPHEILIYSTLCALCFLFVRFGRMQPCLGLLFCLGLASVMWWTPDYKSVSEITGNVVTVNSGSVLVQSSQGTFQVSTTKPLHLDDQVKVKGTSYPIEDQPSFFGFQGEKWAKQKRLSGRIYAKTVTLLHPGKTIRHAMHLQLEKVPSTSIRSLWLKLLLNVKSQSEKSWDLVLHCGFHYGLLLYWLRKGCNFFMEGKYADRIRLMGLLIISIILRFPVAISRLWLKEPIQFLKNKSRLTRCCLEYGLFACLFPHYVSSAIFLFPCVFSFYQCIHKPKMKERSLKLTMTLLLQGWLFSEVSWGMILAMPILRRFLAFSTMLGIVGLFFPWLCYLLEPIFSCFEWLEKLPIWHGKPNLIIVLFLYLLVVVSKRKEKQVMFLLCVCLLYLTGMWYPFASITFINVGQGDSILIRLPYNQANVLIDTGKPSAYPSLRSALWARGITSLDLLFLTHGDEDHSGNKDSLCQDFKVKQVIEKQEGNWQIKGLTLNSISPVSGVGDPNEGSLILITQINHLQILLMGDAPKESEAKLLQKFPGLQADVLKLGHHGSDTSTSSSLLVALRPSLAINSSGLHNRYDHPSRKIVDRLNQYRIPLLDTQTSGEIQITFTHFFNFFFTAKKQFGIMNEVIR